MGIESLGYLGIGVPDPDAWADFARDVIGLGVLPARPRDGTRFWLRMDDHPFRFWLEDAPTCGVTVIGWQTPDDSAIDEMTAQLEKAGVDVVAGAEEECQQRQVSRMIHFLDPCGVRTELFCGRQLGADHFVSPLGVEFVTGDHGLGHVVMKTPRTREVVDFYRSILGFRVRDTAEYPTGSFFFLGCNPRHHSVAYVRSRRREGTHHVLCEVKTPDDVGRALDRAREHDVPLMATLGKHANDGMFSFYMRSPAGFGIEIGAGGVQVDDRTWTSRIYTADVWGHHAIE